MRNKQKIVVILGPTASGKTALSIKIAEKFDGFIISADSRQVYKYLDIGTAKITKKEMRGVPHFMIDVASPKKIYSVAEYQKSAKKIIRKYGRNKLPIIVGGTGLYIDALIRGWKLPQVPPDSKLRENLNKKSTGELFATLEKLDPRRAGNIDKHNRIRLIRAIEIIIKSGSPIPELKKSSSYDTLEIGIKISDKNLKKRIAERLKADLRRGLMDEVRDLHEIHKLSWKRLHELGLEYKYIALYLQHEISRKDMEEKLRSALWRYAKRQMTWFKKDGNIAWVSGEGEAARLIKKFLAS